MVGNGGQRTAYNREEDFDKFNVTDIESVREALEGSDQFEKQFPTADEFSYTHDSGYEVRIDQENDEIQVARSANISSERDELRPNRVDYIVHLAYPENEVSKEEVGERTGLANFTKVGRSPFYDSEKQ